MIGGLRRKNDNFTVTKFPILGDIPVMGALFRHRLETLANTDLLVFVTPRIVEDIVFTPKEKDRLELFQEDPEDWASQFDVMKNRKKKISKEPGSAEPGAANSRDYFYLRPPPF